ncbi:hypothetical protein AA313_de0210392 [Arthrobotrys entomopaga]|nr:hypothetical protein AA313_de0210392 [Arthrobotrys entomopaga]
MIVDNPPATYGAGPFSIHSTQTSNTTSSSDDIFTSSPASSSASPIASPSNTDTFSVVVKGKFPVASPSGPTFVIPTGPPCIPLASQNRSIVGESHIKLGEQKCNWYGYDGQTFCDTSSHPVDSILPFEDTSSINGSLFNKPPSPTITIDTEELGDFMAFIKNTVARCIVCQFANHSGANVCHHISACTGAASLGTFLWTTYITDHESAPLDQAVFAITAVVYLVAPEFVSKVAECIREDIPTDYAEFKDWSLQSHTLFSGLKAVKAHLFCDALRILREIGEIVF